MMQLNFSFPPVFSKLVGGSGGLIGTFLNFNGGILRGQHTLTVFP